MPASDLGELRARFAYHPATAVTGPRHAEVRDRCYALALWLADNLPASREASLALTKVQEAMWAANAAVAIHTLERDG